MLSSGGSVTLSSGGTVTLGSGGTIALGSGGNFTLSGGGTIALGSGGTVTLGSGGTVALGSGGVVGLSSGGIVALGSGGTVALGSGGTIALGSGGTVTLGSGGASHQRVGLRHRQLDRSSTGITQRNSDDNAHGAGGRGQLDCAGFRRGSHLHHLSQFRWSNPDFDWQRQRREWKSAGDHIYRHKSRSDLNDGRLHDRDHPRSGLKWKPTAKSTLTASGV